MKDSRDDTIFSLRYAVRVLERQAKLWAVIGKIFKFVSMLSGTAALAAVLSSRSDLAMALGLVFAVAQACDHTLDPADKHAAALAKRREYARVLANATNLADDALYEAYWAVVAEDEISVDQALKELAYNDVVRERGGDPSALYAKESSLLRLLS